MDISLEGRSKRRDRALNLVLDLLLQIFEVKNTLVYVYIHVEN